MSKLVIMESPAKAKTVKKYLGGDYDVIASVGHIRDLPKSLLGVDVEHGFKPRYVDIPGKSALIRQLKEAAAASEQVYLATDPDREGEAIAWHLAQLLKMPLDQMNRVTFNEITRTGVSAGMAAPRSLDMNLVNAQQARRILDRIVGYKLSPFLWKKVRKGLSAGRVQSATVSLVVDREEQIRSFVSEEYWTLDAALSVTEKGRVFPAKLYGTVGNAADKLKITDKQQADAILKSLAGATYTATGVKTGTRRVAPAPPFTTSTMQLEANRKLNFSSRRTMQAAQELYEGVELREIGATGLITYMRTDSLRISDEARKAGNDYIREHYGATYLPAKARTYKTKSNAQDAHEAIRPSVPSMTPESVKDSLTPDQYKLYKLIWERFMASLMADQIQNTCQVDITAGDYLFKASGYTIKFDGHTVLYVEGKDERDEENKPLPVIHEGDVLYCRKIDGNQHFTQPPARYNEATLIKAMEESGIGRPSTYAATVSTVLSREYVERDGKWLVPTKLGEVVTGLMKEQFPQIVDLDFTAHMEQQLDGVESGKADWVKTLDRFYGDFAKTLERAEQDLHKVEVPQIKTDEVCELCGKPMVIKTGRYGKFLACSGYPDCKNTRRLIETAVGTCPKCGGALEARKTKKQGRKFFGCGNYPKCDFATWSEPTGEVCPKCGKTLFRKGGKGSGLHCLTDGCGYEK